MTVTHFPISENHKAEIREIIKKIGQYTSIDIPQKQITFASLLKRPEGCTSGGYSNESLLLKGEHEETYVEYPIDINTNEVKKDLHEKILKHIMREVWMGMKLSSMRLDKSHYAHYDATINTIWNERIQRKHPKLANGMSFTPRETKISSKIKGPQNVWIENDCIRIEMEIPESIAHGNINNINKIIDIIQLPHCGDDKIQEMFENQMVISVKAEQGVITIKTSMLSYPMEDEPTIYPWREIRKFEKKFMATMIEYDPIKYDAEGDVNRVRAELDNFLKKNGTPEQWYANIKKGELCL